MADLNTGTLKGSIVINFGSVRKAEQAIKSLQAQFSGYVKQSNSATKAAQDYTKAAQQQAKATRTQSVSQERILKGYTQLEQAEKQLLVLKRQSAAETHEGTVALKNAAAAVNSYRATLQSTNVTSLRLTDSHETMQQQLIRASVATTGLNSATANARSWFRSSRAAASQFGLQLQDVAVQAQMGTNALVILGQQGSQLLGFFGAGGAMAGALLAIGSAIAYVASTSVEATDKTDLFLTKIKELELGVRDLNRAQRANIELELFEETRKRSAAIDNQKESIKELEREQRLLNKQFREEIEQPEFIRDQRIIDQTSERLDEVRKELVKLRGETSNSEVELEKFKKTYEDFLSGLDESKDALEEQQRSLKGLQAELNTLFAEVDPVAAQLQRFAEQVEIVQEAFLRGLISSSEADRLINALNSIDVSSKKVSKSTKTAKDEVDEYIAKLREEAAILGMSRENLIAHEIAKIAAKDATVENTQAMIEEAQAIYNEIEARQALIDKTNEQESVLAMVKRQYGESSAEVQDFANNQRILAEMYDRTKDPEIIEFMRRYAEGFNKVSESADKAKFSISNFASEIDGIMNSTMQSFTASAAGFAEVFGERLSEGTQKGVVGLGAGIDSMMSLLQTANRESSTEYKRMAQMQATVAGALAIAKIWGQYAAQPWIAGGLTALVAANIGAQIAAIEATNYATGGMVRGPGTGTSDSIPANLSNGEFVMRADAVRKIGVANLNAMNQGRMANFAQGGSVGVVSGGSGNTTVNVIDQRSGGAPVETRESTDQFGNRSIEMIIKDVVRNGMSRGDFDRDMQGNFGVRRPGRRV